ncbi:hypothetical protein C7S18_19165 [Ahniella affigens]|uniref:Uncharacterized protein n=1 Tax=Ahniella affigens TaxID=2021234 RepID=A0A2P1PWD0_9GAMM|nr:hypothetical protein [Ahniella affigens]AVP99158.1 hypothetical protein C7S18_19165 [Ahniella affigens]
MRSSVWLLTTAASWLLPLQATLGAGWKSDEPFLLRLDNYTYPLPAGAMVFSSGGQITFQTPLQLSQCQRQSGGSLVVSSYRLVYDGLGRSLYLSRPDFAIDGGVISLQSSSGDMVCAGGSPAADVFRNSFE